MVVVATGRRHNSLRVSAAAITLSLLKDKLLPLVRPRAYGKKRHPHAHTPNFKALNYYCGFYYLMLVRTLVRKDR